MKKYLFSLLASLICVGSLMISNAVALSDPPDLRVSVANTDETNIYHLGDPVNLILILENMSGTDSIMPFKGFSNQDFRLMLDFAYENNMIIRAIDREKIVFRNNREVPLADVALNESNKLSTIETVESLEPEWWWQGEMDATLLYGLTKPGKILVSAKIPIRSYDTTIPGTTDKAYLCDDESRNDCYAGILESVEIPICITADLDADGYYSPCIPPDSATAVLDCDDSDPNINPAAFEITNNGKDDDCNPETSDLTDYSIITVHVDRHLVGQGNFPGSGKVAESGVEVRIYDRSAGTCAANYSASWQNYSAISGCEELDTEITESEGEVSFQVPQAGSYFLIGKYDNNGEDLFIGRVLDNLAPEEKVYMQIIEKADGKKVPAKNIKRTGSLLMIIQPEYIEWDGTQELYPFVFESVGDWTVGTTVAPPEGFVADQEILIENINMELEAVQFTIVDVGSDWVDTEVTFDLEHKGKKEKIKDKIGIKCAKKLAKEKNFDQFCQALSKEEMKEEKKAEKQAK